MKPGRETAASWVRSRIKRKIVNWPKITVVTPSYNQAPFLEQTILSVLNQNYPNLEYIVLDGGSSDGSVEIIKKYEKKLHYWESKRDKGQSDAISRGFELSSGAILAWLNSDDYYEPGVLHFVAEAFNAEPQVGLVCGDRKVVDRASRPLRTQKMPRFYKWHLHHFRGINQDSAFWRREHYFSAGGIDRELHYVMDLDLWFRLSAITEIRHFPYLFSNYREHSESKSVHFRSGEEQVQEVKASFLYEMKRVRGRYPRSCGMACKWIEKGLLLLQKAGTKVRRGRTLPQPERDQER